jgi:hypothetical protein
MEWFLGGSFSEIYPIAPNFLKLSMMAIITKIEIGQNS